MYLESIETSSSNIFGEYTVSTKTKESNPLVK